MVRLPDNSFVRRFVGTARETKRSRVDRRIATLEVCNACDKIPAAFLATAVRDRFLSSFCQPRINQSL